VAFEESFAGDVEFFSDETGGEVDNAFRCAAIFNEDNSDLLGRDRDTVV